MPQRSPNMLGEILENKRREVGERQERVSLESVKRGAERAAAPRNLSINGELFLIAEIKKRSPSGGDLSPAVDPAMQARAYARGGAAAISVLTDTRYFGGSFADLRAVHDSVPLPILCKDFILMPYQVYEARAQGADMVLLIVAAVDDQALICLQTLTLQLGMMPLVEVHDQHDLARSLAADARLVGINNRDLSDLSVDLLTTEYLAPLVPDDVVSVSESGITTRADVERVARAGVRGMLVGESLMRADDPAAAVRELLS